MRRVRTNLATVLALASLTSACGPPLPPMPDRPLTALEQCRRDVIVKRREGAQCWRWLVLAPYCALFTGLAADAQERQCNAYAFAAEHPSRLDAEVTIHENAPR